MIIEIIINISSFKREYYNYFYRLIFNILNISLIFGWVESSLIMRVYKNTECIL